MGKNLFQKVWDAHTVGTLANGQTQLLIGTHLIHEVTSPQAFGMLRDLGLKVKYPHRTFATVDHIVPTDNQDAFADPLAAEMMQALRRNAEDFGITYFDLAPANRASSTSSDPSRASPSRAPPSPAAIRTPPPTARSAPSRSASAPPRCATCSPRRPWPSRRVKVRRINVDGDLRPGVYAKDVILHIIRLLGAKGGIGYAYEYGGNVFDRMSDGGAHDRLQHVHRRRRPLRLRQSGREDLRVSERPSLRRQERLGTPPSPAGSPSPPMRTPLMTTSSTSTPTTSRPPSPGAFARTRASPSPKPSPIPRRPPLRREKASIEEALEYMKLAAGAPIKGTKIDVAFIGSCTNGRLTDFREVAKYLKGHKVAPGVKAIAVPGTQIVAVQCEQEGLPEIFSDAGFEWRAAGCSMCLAMNPDKLIGDQLCASSSNRNFKGRQGRPTGRTILMSPVMVAAAAITGHITDARELFHIEQPAAVA